MIYSVDRIEENIAILEELETKEKIEVNTSLLPTNIHEGSIIKKEYNKYYLDKNSEIKRREELRSRFNKVKKNK